MTDRINNNFCFGKCPLCSHDKIKILGDIFYTADLYFSDIKIALLNNPQLGRCLSCQTTFTQNSIPPEEMKRLYSSGNSSKRWPAADFFGSKDSKILDTIKKNIKEGDVVADVGCNDGASLDQLRDMFKVKTIGLEYSESSREELRKKGHQVFSEVTDLGSNSVNLITAFDLIEHLHDPKDFLLNCHKALVKGGRLLIVTGNQDSFLARSCSIHWWYIRFPEHIVFPSLKSILDLKIFKVQRITNVYPAPHYKESFKRRLKSFKKHILLENHNGFPMPWGDHMILECTKQ